VPAGSSDPPPDDAEHRAGGLHDAALSDPDAFGEFYDRTNAHVLGFFYRRTACAHTAAELAAETFAEALAGLHRYRPDRGSGRSWLFGIAHNRYRRWLRREEVATRARRRLAAATPTMSPSDYEHIEALVDFGPLVARLDGALGALTPAIRDAVVGRVVDQLPYDEIARRGGCTVNTARVRVSRGLARLAEVLDKESHEP
jgi:RNA polymerase sigma-70 factor (ECF subfamily)